MVVCGTQFKKNKNKLVIYSPCGLTSIPGCLMIQYHERNYLVSEGSIWRNAVSGHHLILIDVKLKGAPSDID